MKAPSIVPLQSGGGHNLSLEFEVRWHGSVRREARRALEAENRKLKHLLAEADLDKAALNALVKGQW